MERGRALRSQRPRRGRFQLLGWRAQWLRGLGGEHVQMQADEYGHATAIIPPLSTKMSTRAA